MTRRVAAALVCALLAGGAGVGGTHAGVKEPAGFRMDHYHGAVPATLRGARVVDTATLAKLIAAGHVVLIDVLPAPRPPTDSRPGMLRMPLPRRDIPGSLWLPDVGRGAISADLAARFAAALRTATGGNKDAAIVFYCNADCWMSWNAAKRAESYGYRRVIWYPGGADGWAAAGRATVIAKKALLF